MTPPPTVDNTIVAVFTYNRGPALRRCLASVERHFPGAKPIIFDDHSDERQSRRILSELSARYEIVRPSLSSDWTYRVGHLQENMNLALDRARIESKAYLFCLQDDIQLVRPLDDRWARQVADIFNVERSIIEVVPLFVASHLGRAYCEERFRPHVTGLFYGTDRDDPTWGVCDTGIFYVPRLEANNFRFLLNEVTTSSWAWERGLRFVDSRDPVMMQCPWPRVFRRERERSTLPGAVIRAMKRINEWGVGAGKCSLLDMAPEAVDRLLARPIGDLPYAEMYLQTDLRVKMPWYYSDYFDRRKLRGRYLLTGRWIWDGPVDYIERVRRDRDWFRDLRRL